MNMITRSQVYVTRRRRDLISLLSHCNVRSISTSEAAHGGLGMDPTSSERSTSDGPLKGYRVLDVGQVVAGNFAGALFGYFGAEVIKVEPPGRGDALRHLRDLDASGNTSLWWRSYGRNRYSLTVDLHHEKGREIVKHLSEKCDVLLENFRPGVMEKWGLGPADLGKHLVYTRISGYGQTGPKATLPGYASVCEAFGGFRYINGYSDRAPVRPNISLGDSLAGMHAAFGAVMALLHRDGIKSNGGRTRKHGQVVDAAISESMYNMLEGCVTEYFASGSIRPPSGSTLTGVVPSGCWKANDGVYVIIGGNGNSVYDRLMTAVGRPDMTTQNPRYATDSKRCLVEKEICDEIEAWVAKNSSGDVMKVLSAARVPAGPILNVEDIVHDEQYKARGMFERTTPPASAEEFVLPAMVPVLSDTPGHTKWAGPDLGQHTDKILTELLEMSQDNIDELREIGAI